MSWLAGRSSHAHGLSQPSYRWISNPLDAKELESVRDSLAEDLWPDRDGFRQPVFEVIEHLPKEILDRKIQSTLLSIKSAAAYLEILVKETPA